MIAKVLLVVAFAAVSLAGVVPFSKDYYAYPQYKFSYGVKDPYTGDNKAHYEQRDGDSVKGSYTVAEPDGTIRTVHYTADDHNGFNAVVEREGKASHPQIYAKEVPEYQAEHLGHH